MQFSMVVSSLEGEKYRQHLLT